MNAGKSPHDLLALHVRALVDLEAHATARIATLGTDASNDARDTRRAASRLIAACESGRLALSQLESGFGITPR